jgi:monoamine oxidase
VSSSLRTCDFLSLNFSGTQSVAKGITKLLPSHSVKLGVVVTKLEDFDAFTKVHTSSGEIYTARKVILSIPSPLYKDIQFQPPLQDRGHFASTSTYLGFYTKVILVYKRAWWTDSGLCGLSLSFNSPVVVARDTSSPADGQYSLTCFVNGSVGREWSKLGEAERRSAVIDHVALMYGNPQEAKEPLTVLEKQWMGEQWSQGAVCPITRPGALGTVGFGRLEPHGNIHFVGTEYSDEWKGYMEGAVCSGEVGAAEVLSSLLENPRRPAGTVLARL